MKRDEIEAMMQEAGLKLDAYDSKSAAFWYTQIELFAHLVAKHTQQKCAKVCQDRYMGDNTEEDMESGRCAEEIMKMTV